MTINRAFIALFLAALSLPLAGQIAGFGTDTARIENRAAAAFPPVPASLQAVQQWPAGVDAWISDHFGFRGPLMALHRATGQMGQFSPGALGQVLEGRDGWLFLADDSVLADYMGREAYTDQRAGEITAALEETVRRIESTGAKALVAIVPNKITVYPDYVPDYIPAGETRMTGLAPYLDESTLPIVYLKDALLTEKQRELVYYLADTHWNARGAYAGYRAIMEAWRETAPDVPVLPDGAVTFRPFTMQAGGLARMLNPDRPRPEESVRAVVSDPPKVSEQVLDDFAYYNFRTRIFDTGNTDAPSLLIIGDSFSDYLLPFLQPEFSRVVLTHHRYGNFDPEILERYPSDYVLVIFVERFLANGWGEGE